MKPNKVGILDYLTSSSGKVHQYSAVHSPLCVCPAVLSVNYKDPVRVLIKEKTDVHQTSD